MYEASNAPVEFWGNRECNSLIVKAIIEREVVWVGVGCPHNPSCVTYLSNMVDYAVRLIFYCALKHISGL
jgi:hypothetical protein